MAAVTGAAVLTRASPGEYAGLTFLMPGVTVEVEISPRVVQGQVVPPPAGLIRLERCDGTTVEGPVDVDGWFRLGPPPPGAFRLQLTGPDGAAVRTPWVGRS